MTKEKATFEASRATMSDFRKPRFDWGAAVIALLFTVLPAGHAPAQDIAAAQAMRLGQSGLPLPRFVSLKADKVNLRIGPGLGYPVEWMYMKSGMPMEIIQEYDNWRRVRDADGVQGWINQSLLSGRRTAIIAPWQRGKSNELSLLAKPGEGASVVAYVEPGVIGELEMCNGEWCLMDFNGRTGWIRQTEVWGAYPGETYTE